MPYAQGFVNGYTNAYTFSVCPKTQEQEQTQQHQRLSKLDNKNQQQQPLRLRQGPGAFLSFDYYVDMSRPNESIIQDLLQLFAANPRGPYFLNAHVREFNSETRVADLMDQVQKILASNKNSTGYNKLELVSSDVMTELAGKFPTFRQHFS